MSNNYKSTLQSNNTELSSNNLDLQALIDQANALPDAGGVDLPELTNEGTAADLLSGKELIDGDGNKVTGTIPTKTSSNITVSGATVTVPSGYYATQTTKSIATATRAETTISVTADDTNDKLTITASNNQGTGYVTGANKTASKTISLTASGATVTASDGANSISKSVQTATQATPSITINASGLITATATQSEGYVTAGSKSDTKQLTTQAAKTITPTKSSQTAVAKDVYTTGAITVGAIPSEYITTTDANATASDIFANKTAYVNGSKVSGTFTIDNELSTQDDLIAQIQAAVDNLPETSVEPNLQDKTVTPTTTSQTVKADTGYDGLDTVTVNAMPAATQATPSISVDSNGKITASATQSAGYVVAGTKSTTKQLTVQAAKTVTPSTSSQTAVASGVYTTGAVTVAAVPTQTKTATPTTSTQTIAPDSGKFLSQVTINPIPSGYIQPSGTKTITTNGTHDVTAYASATVNVAGEDVTTEVSAYTSKIASLEAAVTALENELEGKASGTGSSQLNTCTVNINYSYPFGAVAGQVFVTYAEVDVDTQSVVCKQINITDTNPADLTNVLCGSFVVIEQTGGAFDANNYPNGIWILGKASCYLTPIIPNETLNINIEFWD
jgi:hypothetical protein